MAVDVAMLRGINVGGQKSIRMEDLRASFETLGFDSVETNVQSGNIVFEAPEGSGGSLIRKLSKARIIPVIPENCDQRF